MNNAVDTAELLPIDRVSDDDLCLTGPGTPAGDYLRRYWQPVYHSTDLAQASPVPLRIMNQDFTLFRGASGEVHLFDARCPHRGTQLSTGWVEGDALRCFYHGWKFGPGGDCVEQPAEENASIHKVSLRTWPVREYLGLVFAYLGDDEPPTLPRFPEFEHFDGLLELDSYSRHCNYFQNLENALDMSHVGFVHGDNRAAFTGIGLGRSLQAVESSWGVTYTFTRPDGRRRVQQFGMPNVFYMTALPNEDDVDWQESLFWWVPVDDDSHMQFSLHRVPLKGSAAESFKTRRQARRSVLDIAHQPLCEQILDGAVRMSDVDRSRVDMVRLQDDIAQVGQGRRADRTTERLGRSDIGVAVTRRLWRREVAASMDGKPLTAWMRGADIVPRVWDLTPGRDDASRLGDVQVDVTPEIIDIRPHVEVDEQLRVLHGFGLAALNGAEAMSEPIESRRRHDVPVPPGPMLTLAERDRRWAGLRASMRERGIDAIVVGSFQGRERLESYLMDDFLDAIVVLPLEQAPVAMSFATGRISRSLESARRGFALWIDDLRVGFGGAKVAEVLVEKGLARGRIGIVGYGPTAPGEVEGLLPLGFHRHLTEALPQADVQDFTLAFTDFMLVKSDEELNLLRYAAMVSERACTVMADVAEAGVGEALVYAEVMREIYRHGCDVRYPFFSLQSGADNIGWGAPRWSLRAEPPRVLERGDVVQAEIHTMYGAQEAQVQMCVALDPLDVDLQRCEAVARRAYEAGLRAVRPGATFGEVAGAMEAPIAAGGCWSKTPLLHTLTFGSTGFTSVNRAQLAGTSEWAVEGRSRPGVRRGDLVLKEGMSLELEPNACIGLRRVNIGAGVVVRANGAEELNTLATRVFHK